jgi:glycosyltransferase involved in cell wall biosynthesis
VYNRRDSLPKTVSSIHKQAGHSVSETIVVDDASVDDSAEVAESLGCEVIRLPTNGGSAAARNAALERVSTPWVAFLDSDDMWHEDFLTTLWPHTAANVLISGAAFLSINDTPVTLLGADRPPGRRLTSPADLLLAANPVVTSATLVRADLMTRLGGFDTSLRYSEDLDLWLRLLELGEGWCDAKPVLTYRRGSSSKSQQTHGLVEESRAHIARSYATRPWWSKRACEQYLGANYWEGTRSALRGRAFRAAAVQSSQVVRSPLRLRGALASMVRNSRRRRRLAQVAVP